MKKHITAPFKIITLFFLFVITGAKVFAAGEEPTVEKRKTYNKTYPLSANQKVSVKNSFGTVVINNYKGSEVKVEVTVIVKASTDERAQTLLDNIDVIDKNGSTVSFETKIDNNNNNNNRGRKNESQTMEVNYQVYLPESNPLELQNEFGKAEVGDRSGLTNITEKFGDLVTGNLSNVEEVRVEFGSIKAEKLSGGKTIFKYSEVNVKGFGGDVKCSLEFSSTKIGFTNAVTDANISNSYSDVEITFPKDFNGTYSIHTSFCDFDNNTSFKIKEVGEEDEDSGPKFDKDFSGKSGNGAANVKIKSSFGEIKFK